MGLIIKGPASHLEDGETPRSCKFSVEDGTCHL